VKYRDRIDESLFPPQVNWRNVHNDRKRNRSLTVAAR
jgi:hypothetical protein